MNKRYFKGTAMAWLKFVALVTVLAMGGLASEPDLIIVHIEQGPIKGANITSATSNKTFIAFMGIPYAKPPTGDNRFKAPAPAGSWDKVRNATEEGAVCPQINPSNEELIGDEDCLFINVFTPKFSSETLKPVMVWIHGGEFVTGSGNRGANGPENILDEDVVFVSFNYRIGILGFLSLQNEEVPGNNGMKDQVMALKWVKQNIAKFGGDPNKVTIFGEGSGGSCVHYHMLSPMSRGLFHRAISQSGTPLNPWNTVARDSSERMVFALREALKVNSSETELLESLRNCTAHDLVTFFHKALTKPIVGDLIGPTLDTHASEGQVFLNDTPAKMTKEYKMAQVPYMVGFKNDEGMAVFSAMGQLQWLLEPVVDVFEKALPYYIGEIITKAHDMALEVKDRYFNNSKPLLHQYADVITDHLYTTPSYCIAHAQANVTNSSVFAYLFASNGSDHNDKPPYVFRSNVSFESGSFEDKMSRRFTKLWTNFAKTGNPTPEPDSKLNNINWTPVTQSIFSYVVLDSELQVKNASFNGSPIWWQQLYEKYIPETSPCWGHQ